jgi:hypothetical protein
VHVEDSALTQALGKTAKTPFRIMLYCVGFGSSFLSTWFDLFAYTILAAIGFITEERIESKLIK